MKKKMVITFGMMFLGACLLAGCGKSDEEKAREEIMSHMDAAERAGIASDQKEMEEWEAEQQAKKEAAEAERAAIPDYSEDVLTTYDIEWQIPLKVIFISEDYLEDSSGENSFSSQIDGTSLLSSLGNAWFNGSASYAKSCAEQNTNDGFYERYANYTLCGWDTGATGGEYKIIATDLLNNSSIQFTIYTNNHDTGKDIYDKNIKSLKEQLEKNAAAEYDEVVAYEEIDRDTFGFGVYRWDGTDAIIGSGDTGDNVPLQIQMQGAHEFKGALKWRISEDTYEYREGETWLQVQFADDKTITIKSSDSTLDGTYTKEY